MTARVLMAKDIAPGSWLNRPEFEAFRKALAYAGTQTLAIPALSKVEPEELFYAYELLKRGEAKATGKIAEHLK